jgi:hypothetical protein
MNYRLFHDLTFDVLYGCITVLIYVVLERAIYLTYLSLRMNRGPRSSTRRRETPGQRSRL